MWGLEDGRIILVVILDPPSVAPNNGPRRHRGAILIAGVRASAGVPSAVNRLYIPAGAHAHCGANPVLAPGVQHMRPRHQLIPVLWAQWDHYLCRLEPAVVIPARPRLTPHRRASLPVVRRQGLGSVVAQISPCSCSRFGRAPALLCCHDDPVL